MAAIPYKGIPNPLSVVNAAANANRVNTVTPGGTGTWKPGVNGGPATYTTTLNPAQRQINSSQDNTLLNASVSGGRVLSNPTLDFSKIPKMTVNPGMTGQNAIMARLAPQIDRERSQLHTQLVNWGLQPGSEAYNNAMARQGERENDLLSQAAAQGINLDTSAHQQGVSDQQAAIQTPLNTLNTLRAGGEAPYSPGNGIAGSTPDALGAWNAMNSANTAAKNQNKQNTTDWPNAGAAALPSAIDWAKGIDWSQFGF